MKTKLTAQQQLDLLETPIPLHARQEIVDAFHRLTYDEARRGKSWHEASWRGVPVFKTPMDLWNYAQLIFEVKPKTIIETGTAQGGSAYFFADLLELVGKQGTVVTIDINPLQAGYPAHKRIRYLPGTSSLNWQAPRGLLEPVMVILDSDHSAAHVLKELERFHAGVTVGSYLVVEDSNVGGHPVNPSHGPGPSDALAEWLPHHPEFVIDAHIADRFLFSYHTWLRRVERPASDGT